jgi:uncharacterized protein (DUF342 family)
MSVKLITEDIRRSATPMRYEDNVEVMGTVLAGAKVEVTGDIAIHGNVEDAEIEAQGDVLIDGGFLGAGKGSITCSGSFNAGFVQRQRVVARGDVRVKRAIVSSMIFSSGGVLVGDSDGAIVGGEIHAYRNVEAGLLGSRRPVTTRIEAGVDPIVALAIESLESEVMQLTKRRMGFLKDLFSLSRNGGREGATDETADLRAAADAIHADIIAAGERIMALRKDARLNPDATVSARRVSYPPLEVSICFVKILNEAATDGVTFRFFDDRIILDTWGLD